MKQLPMNRLCPVIQTIAKGALEIDAVFLFGSLARRRAHAQSDLDLAVLFSPHRAASFRRVLLERFQEKVERATGYECDAIDLAEASTWMRYHVLKTGQGLYERSEKRCRFFVAKSLLDYFDFQPVYERMERRLLERLKAA